MSDEVEVPQGPEAEAGPDEATAAEAADPVENPVEFFEIDDEIGAKHVKIKVDGEETSVPLKELAQGYQRQADYTHKTQTLAEQRKEAESALALQQALQANPGLTMQVLAQRAGMSVQEFLGLSNQQQNNVAQATVQEPEYTDPLEQQLAQSNSRLEQLEQRLAQEQADRELRDSITGLKQQYQASDEDIRLTVQTAMQQGLPLQALPMVYRSIAFEKSVTQQAARQEAGQTQAAQQQARQQAAAQAASVVGTGSGATGTTQDQIADGKMSLHDAIMSGVANFPD